MAKHRDGLPISGWNWTDPSSHEHIHRAIQSPTRLAELIASGLPDSVTVAALDALTQVALHAIGDEVASLVTAVTSEHQVILSAAPDAPADEHPRVQPLSYSMCQFVVASGEPVVVGDTAAEPGLANQPAVTERGVGAYAGFPLHGPRGEVLGAVCVISREPRAWTSADLQVLRSLTTAAEFVVSTMTLARRERLARTSGAVPADQFARLQHNIRTPLTSLLGLLDLLLAGTAGDFSDDQVEALSRCRHNAERLRQAVNDLH